MYSKSNAGSEGRVVLEVVGVDIVMMMMTSGIDQSRLRRPAESPLPATSERSTDVMADFNYSDVHIHNSICAGTQT